MAATHRAAGAGTLARFTIVGASAFWVANFAISLTSIATDYRSGLSIAYVPMLVEALFGGLAIGLGVSYALLRWTERNPASTPLRTSLILGAIAFALVTSLIEAPAKLFTSLPGALRYFLIGAAFNTARLLALALAIGYSARRVGRERRQQ